MQTFYIHIKGLVQGVGFRPHICRIANTMNLTGQVSNGNNGVHIEINASSEVAEVFLKALIVDAPKNSIITHTELKQIENKKFVEFSILVSEHLSIPELIIPPDFSICSNCKKEIQAAGNKRNNYAFTTCLECGPRYSIIENLPYDREHTTMKKMDMCVNCEQEYHNIEDRRHYSQTNSCPHCAIPMHLFNTPNSCLHHTSESIIPEVVLAIKAGKTVAVKNTGGYILLCDATNKNAIQVLRNKKKRPTKPLAILYPNELMAKGDVIVRPTESKELNSIVAPIVLCSLRENPASGIEPDIIAPALDKLGVLLPSSPLLYLIASEINRPLVATSGNISGAPIIYEDTVALENLFEVANLVLTYDRVIVAPQDDSVIQFTERGQKIILRRSRGLAPNYYPNPFNHVKENILATGGELKSAFAYSVNNNLYISQFLGDQGHLESQEAYAHTFKHFQKLFKVLPEKVLIDLHPNYFVSAAGKEIGEKLNVPVIKIQHHKAHFASVLTENNLLNKQESVLGFIWDGTGYGEDGQIWGSELFSYKEGYFSRLAHLAYFPVLVGDKMSKEPRLSALSILKQLNEEAFMKKQFTTQEWQYYLEVLENTAAVSTSSMGRFLDAIACIIGLNGKTSFEGEALMKLESIARNSYAHKAYYSFTIEGEQIQWNEFIKELLLDIVMHKEQDFIARKVINSLVELIALLSDKFGFCQLAFSGGVFQNALLVDLIIEKMKQSKLVYFQQQVSPNDEGIALGQFAYYLNESKTIKPTIDKVSILGEPITEKDLINF
jgi:hydrogenase maturation protein HypF